MLKLQALSRFRRPLPISSAAPFMDRITRYIATELAIVFAISATIMTMLMLMVFLVQEGTRESLTLGTIAELVPYTIPTALSFAIPGTCLFATCVVYGRMSAMNEIIAVKAQGIPPSRLIWPGLIIAFLLSLCTLYLNDLAVSWGRKGVYNVILNASAKTIYSVLSAQGSFSKDRMSIVVDEVRDDTLINAHIEVYRESSKTQIQATQARIHVDQEESMLVLKAQNARIQIGDGGALSRPGWWDIPIPLGNVTKREGPGRNPSSLPLRNMSSELKHQIERLRQLRQKLAMRAAFEMAGGNLLSLTNVAWKHDLEQLKSETHRKFRLQTEPWRRWANGFSCLCFVIVGAPLAIRMRKSDFWTIFAVCFIPILLAYYPLLMIGVGQAKSGAMPPFIVWLGNAAMLLVGMLLTRQIQQH